MTYYFKSEELECRHCGKEDMHPIFMEKLNDLREECEFPFIVTSAYRCKEHNKDVGGHPKSAHMKGRAIDILCDHEKAQKIIALARKYGFNGIGVYQQGKQRFCHLDDCHTTFKLWSK